MRKQECNETFYPRAADELREIENLLGPAVVLLNINKQILQREIDDPIQEKVEEKEDKPKKIEGGEEGEENPEEEAAPEEGGKKSEFNPDEF